MADLEFGRRGPACGDLDDVHPRNLMGSCLSDSTQDLRQRVQCANELRLDGAVLYISDPPSNSRPPAAVLNMGPEADALNDSLEANSKRVVFGHGSALEGSARSMLDGGFT
jgi:hypothetical protein